MSAWVKVLEAFVPGMPRTKGSTRAYVVKGRAIITNDNRDAKPWQHAVAWEASEKIGLKAPTAAPVFLSATFYFDRPASHYGKHGVLPSAPKHPAKKPDLDKALRVVLDALTGVVYRDDAQVVGFVVHKAFSTEYFKRGVFIAAMVEGAPMAAGLEAERKTYAWNPT